MIHKKNLIWSEQENFHQYIQHFADDLFDKFDKNLEPSVILLGVSNDNSQNPPKIYLETKDNVLFNEEFSNIRELKDLLEKKENLFRIIRNPELSIDNEDESYKKMLEENNYQKAVENMIDELFYLPYFNEISVFCSYPTEVNGFYVFIILLLNKKIFDSYVFLKKEKMLPTGIKTNKSLLECISLEFKYATSLELRAMKDYSGYIRETPYELILRAGRRFMSTISRLIDEDKNFNIFEDLNTISSLKYEGQENFGKLILSNREDPFLEVKFKFVNPVKIQNHRKIRKLLEITDNENCLLCDSNEVYGIGKIRDSYNPNQENIFLINFDKHYNWALCHDNKILMKVSYREPSIYKPIINYKNFESGLKRTFLQISNEQISNLWDIATSATYQKHGTMIVILDKKNALKESNRLENQSIKIQPKKLDEQLLKLITNIDGSILIDTDCICYSLGVILDGKAIENNGDSTRGARYNSAITYRKNIKCDSFIIVISEDGMINLIPDLNPKIYKKDINLRLEELSEISKKKYNDFKINEFSFLMKWINNHKFYFIQEECNNINSYLREISNNIIDLRIPLKNITFEPDPEMNDSYYLEDLQ